MSQSFDSPAEEILARLKNIEKQIQQVHSVLAKRTRADRRERTVAPMMRSVGTGLWKIPDPQPCLQYSRALLDTYPKSVISSCLLGHECHELLRPESEWPTNALPFNKVMVYCIGAIMKREVFMQNHNITYPIYYIFLQAMWHHTEPLLDRIEIAISKRQYITRIKGNERACHSHLSKSELMIIGRCNGYMVDENGPDHVVIANTKYAHEIHSGILSRTYFKPTQWLSCSTGRSRHATQTESVLALTRIIASDTQIAYHERVRLLDHQRCSIGAQYRIKGYSDLFNRFINDADAIMRQSEQLWKFVDAPEEEEPEEPPRQRGYLSPSTSESDTDSD